MFAEVAPFAEAKWDGIDWLFVSNLRPCCSPCTIFNYDGGASGAFVIQLIFAILYGIGKVLVAVIYGYAVAIVLRYEDRTGREVSDAAFNSLLFSSGTWLCVVECTSTYQVA